MTTTIEQARERYEAERAKLLGQEGDLDVLWRVIVAADHLSRAVDPTPKRALIVVDVQNDFANATTGSLYVFGGEAVAKRVGELLRGDLSEYSLVVSTQDWHQFPGDHWSDDPDFVNTWPVHCKANTFGAELHSALDGGRIDRKFYKGATSAAYSGFEASDGDAGLGEYLLSIGVTDVDVVGIASDYCVKATAIDAVKYGFRTRVLLPYTAAVDGNGGLRDAIADMEAVGVTIV